MDTSSVLHVALVAQHDAVLADSGERRFDLSGEGGRVREL